MSDLESRLASALEADDGAALIDLYLEAEAQAESAVQRAFFLTHAMVHALEAGDARADELRARLAAMGCEDAPRSP